MKRERALRALERAAMRVYAVFMLNPGFIEELKGNRGLMAKMLRACHRHAAARKKERK